MPHAVSSQDMPASQEDDDEDLIQQALDPESKLDFSRELEPGEKAEDAVDFEDLSDNDLADDDELENIESKGVVSSSNPYDVYSESGKLGESNLSPGAEPLDDLFGDDATALTRDPEDAYSASKPSVSHGQPESTYATNQQEPLRSGDTDRHQLQQELFALSRSAFAAQDGLPEPPTNRDELLTALWPHFEHASTPKFMKLLPPKRARYVGKQIHKAPRAVNPTKVNLELAHDQDKSFKVLSEQKERAWKGSLKSALVQVYKENSEFSGDEDVAPDMSEGDSDIHGVSWQDLQLLCEDWDELTMFELNDPERHPPMSRRSYNNQPSNTDELNPAYETQGSCQIDQDGCSSFEDAARLQSPSIHWIDDPESSAAHVAKRVKLDLNDPYLLIDDVPFVGKTTPVPDTLRHKVSGDVTYPRTSRPRYNISNDDAYDLLKENHQHKIRGVLHNSHVEHSIPALRLQWPFYKTRLEKHEARAFHRPVLKVARQETISFQKPHFTKRKHTKGKDARSLFAESKDLSLGDNSNILLLEYAEEFPTMLSNLGMGNKVINYYRKKGGDDSVRPKMDIGELNVLLPQDKSPFSIFGHVDPGQVTPAIYNGMYRAPIFKHEVKDSDFMIVRETTGVGGSSYFLRNVDHLHLVGQEFPLVDVPGPHSRKVTTASKNRLKMISYRLARKNKSHRINVSEVTRHFIDTTDMQNRQKMKEFMQFDKEHKEWRMRPNESIPDADTVRGMVKPEDVCLLESMQVGQQHLQDAGFSKDDDDESEEEIAKEGENIEQQLAPWFTSRNFLHASQGKAMLRVYGDGDPTGRGLALSFIKTSMKGGFQAKGESVAERISNKKMEDSSHHKYNVQKQQEQYEQSIRRVWDTQKQSLSSTVEQSDPEMDVDEQGEESDDLNLSFEAPTSEGKLPGGKRGRDDESASQSTRWSTNSQTGRIMEISRTVRDRYGNQEEVKDIIRNPRVIRQYLRRRRALDSANVDVLDIKPGDDAEENRRKEQRLKKELARLERNKDRRIARDKQKGILTDGLGDGEGSPMSPGAIPAKSAGTHRKCANCGQVGHIKTNKKLCPMLNGTMKPDEGFSSSAFTAGASST